MRKLILLGILLFESALTSAQVFQVDSSGNVTSTASFISTGMSPGQVTLVEGSPLIMPSASSFSLVAPANIPISYQAIVPSAGAGGWWRGTYGDGSAATGTVTESGGKLQTGGVMVTNGGTGYTIAPACWITGGGGSGGACVVTAVPVTTANVMITNVGSGYTSSATLHFGSQIQMTFAELAGDASTTSSNTVTVTGIQGVPVGGTVGSSGNKVQLTSTATSTNNDVAIYDGSGNVTDSGTQVSSFEHVLSAQFSTSDSKSCNSTETDFSTTYSLPSGYIVANKLLRVTIGLSVTSNGSPPGMAFNLKLGSTSVYTATQVAPPPSLSASPGGVTFYIQGTAAASGSASVHVHPVFPPVMNGSTGVPFDEPTVTQPVGGIATNTSLAIKAGLVCSATSSTTGMTLNQMVVEALN